MSKNVYLQMSYIHREDNRRECYSGNRIVRFFEKAELGEVRFKHCLTYRAPEGMTKKEVATLVSYCLHSYVSFEKRSCRTNQRHVSDAVATDIFTIQFVNNAVRKMFEDYGFVCDFPKTSEEAKGLLSLEICDVFDKGLAKTEAAKNFAQWKDLYKDEKEVDRITSKYFQDRSEYYSE